MVVGGGAGGLSGLDIFGRGVDGRRWGDGGGWWRDQEDEERIPEQTRKILKGFMLIPL